MKLGESGDPINSISFRVELGFRSPSNVEKESKKVISFIDKTTETIDYGSRKRELASFNLVDIANDDYVTLIDYLDNYQGQEIKIEQELTGENIFSYSSYYVYLVGFNGRGEKDFSQNRSRFSCELTVAFIGINLGDKYNDDDSSLIDVLIEIDTIRADYEQSVQPSGLEGERWFDTDDNKLYKYINGSWKYLYTVLYDNGSFGVVDGKIYWSLFSDISKDLAGSPDSVNQNYVSGFINKNSLRLPLKSINLFNGPAIAYKKGFSFSVKNYEPFWNWVIQNDVALYGSKITLYLFNKNGSNKHVTKIASGINNSNSFSYKDYSFNVEPLILNNQSKFNKTLILDDPDRSNDRYHNIREDFANKAPYRTFGIWEKAALQNISKEDKVLSYTNTFSSPGQTGNYFQGLQTLNGSLYTYIYFDKNEYSLSSDDYDGIDNNPTDYAIYVVSDTNADTGNIGESSPIIGIAIDGANYRLEISFELPIDPSSSLITFSIVRKSFIHQADGNINNQTFLGFSDPIDLYTYNNEKNDLIPLPSSGFNVNQNNLTDNTTIYLSSDQSINLKGIFQFTSAGDYFPSVISNSISPLTISTSYNEYIYDSNTYIPHKVFGVSPTQYSIIARNKIAFFEWRKEEMSSNLKTNYAASSVAIGRKTSASSSILVDNGYMFSLRFPISHSNDLNFSGKEEYRLCFDFDFSLRSYIYDLVSSQQRFSHEPIGVDIVVRFKKKDGTYIDNNDWKISLSRSQMGVGSDINEIGKCTINNFPDGDSLNGGFGINTGNNASNFDYIIKHIGTYATGTTATGNDKGYDNTSNSFIEFFAGTTLDSGYPIPTSNDVILHLDTQNAKCDRYTYTGSSLTLTDSDYNYTPVVTGRDLFDITEMFTGDNPTWNIVESMEVLFLNGDFAETDHNRNYLGDLEVYDGSTSKDRRLIFDFDLNRAPTIYYSDEFDVTDKKIFTEFTGPDLGTNQYSDADLIIKNILSESYGSSNYDSTSVDSLMSNKNWSFRKQFYDSIESDTILKEILWATFSCAIYNENDQIELKSLSESDYNTGTTSYQFTDSDIIDGSYSIVKMRDSDEIYQNYELKYDFYPPGKFSSSIDDYKKFLQINYSNPINNDLKDLITRSEALFENKNDFKKNIEYHYNLQSMKELSNSIARHFIFNSWEIGFSVSLSNFLNGNKIDYMDYISLTSDFLTLGNEVRGFVSSIQLDIYNGIASIKIYIPSPPGFAGPFSKDVFKDALYIANRDTSGWAANNQINDAGRISTRTASGYTKDDADQISTRDFKTWG